MEEKDRPRVDDIIDDPDAAINGPKWTDMAVRRSIETKGPNAGNLTYPASIRHAEFVDANRQVLAEYHEFDETINLAVNMEASYFANPDITEEEAIRRLKWARERARVAVDQARLIQETADTIRGTDPDFIPPEAEALMPVNPDLPLVEPKVTQEIDEGAIRSQEKPKTLEESYARLERRIELSNNLDDIKNAILFFTMEDRGGYSIDGFFFKIICESIDKLQDEKYSQDEKDMWLNKIPESHGIRAAVVKIMGARKDEHSPELGPDQPTPVSPEAKIEFRNIPLKNGRIINGYVESASAISVLIMTPQGRMEIGRSELLNYNEVYSLGDKVDSDRLMSLQKDDAKIEYENQRRQNPPAQAMQMGRNS